MWFLDAIKRRNFLSGLLAAPLLRGLHLFQWEDEKCGAKVLHDLDADAAEALERYKDVLCSLRKGHKGPHVWLNPD